MTLSPSFETIPATVVVPGSYTEFSPNASITTPPRDHKVLLVGHIGSGSPEEANAGALRRVFSAAEVSSLYGANANLVPMAESAFRNRKSQPVEVWVYGIEDAGGTIASGKVEVTAGTPADGTIVVRICRHTIRVKVASGETIDDVVTNIASAITTAPGLPFVGVADTVNDEVNVLGTNAGTWGNRVQLTVNYYDDETDFAGLTISTVELGDTGGGGTAGVDSGTPYADCIAAMAGQQFDTVVLDTLADATVDLFEAEMLTRWGGVNQLDGHIFIASEGSQSDMLADGNARNSKHTTIIGAGTSPSAHFVWSSAVGMADAAANQRDPARQRRGVVVDDLFAPTPSASPDYDERTALIPDGISTFTNNKGQVVLERLVTTEQTFLGVPTTRFRDLVKIRTLSAMRYEWNARIQLKYPNYKYGTVGENYSAGQAVVTNDTLRAEAIQIGSEWVFKAWMDNFDEFKDLVQAGEDPGDPDRANMILPPKIIRNLRVVASQISFR